VSPSDDGQATPSGTPAVTHVAALGAGLIGRSWAALFLAAGKTVTIYDPDPHAESRTRATIEHAWPMLTALGLTADSDPERRLTVCDDPRVAVDGAQFVQESIPESLSLKHDLYAAIEPVLADGGVVASSASGLTLTELQAGWRNPAPLVLGHPFNPHHLIPLVEVMGNHRTAPDGVARARAFYSSVGKVTIEVRREVPGHVANRLQAALWREAIHLVNEGVATVHDIDTAVSSGPGIRWAAMGPTALFHLGGDEGGLAAFGERYADSFNRWWDDLGTPYLDQATIDRLVAGFGATNTDGFRQLAARRDRLVAAVVTATHTNDQRNPADGR